MKLEGVIPASTSTPADTVIPVIHSESASSSESDVSNGGIEADTEESMTSEEEPDKPAGATSDSKELTTSTCTTITPSPSMKDKWIAVKGHPASLSSDT